MNQYIISARRHHHNHLLLLEYVFWKTASTWPPLQVAKSSCKVACSEVKPMSSQRPQTAALALELLQLNVEGLTIAKTNVLEQIANKNNVMLILLPMLKARTF